MHEQFDKKKGGRAALAALILVVAAAVAAVMLRPEETTPQPVGKPVQTPAVSTESTVPLTLPEIETEPRINLGYGLEITDSGKYSGLYMEDGSDELLSDVMMVIVRNNGEQDVQLADFTVSADGGEYRFRLTNLAAGERAVLLDLDRKPSGGTVSSAAVENVALFAEPMALCEDRISVSGMDGMLNVQNISGEDIKGDIFVYYKYAAQDLYYGGITFRVRVEGGLKAGEIRQIPAGHYTAEGCAIVQVMIYD